jgi:uncharacterized protein DUF5985
MPSACERIRHVAETVYLLCAFTSLVCAVLLGRAYRRSDARILLWSTLCFVFLTINNILLYLDLAIYPGDEVDLSIPRNLTTLVGLGLLVFGLIWDAE